MTSITAVTVCFNDIVLGLTPIQRWDAVTKHHTTNTANYWFIRIGIGLIVLLTVLLLIQLLINQIKKRKSHGHSFSKSAKEKGLTDREFRMLTNIATRAGLKRMESIFTLPSAFDRGAANMVEDALEEEGIEQSRQLQIEISFLREKIGLRKLATPGANAAADMTTLKSQEIPEKKKLFIKRHHRENGDLEATIIKNTPSGLTVEFRTPIEVVFGQFWICRYYSGTYVAEFDTTPIKCSGRVVVLRHSNNVRLVNRRRFLRVPVKTPAYVASFPFTKNSADNNWAQMRKNSAFLANRMNKLFEPPRFIPATVTELGGPGLRIEADLDVTVGDRVLLIFKLEPGTSNRKSGSEKIIEDVAKVRHITKNENVSSIALEFLDLDDNEIDELVRTTNEVSIGMNKWKNYYPGSANRNKQTVKLQPA